MPRLLPAGAALGALLAPASAAALDATIGGVLQTDIRYRPTAVTVGDWYARTTLPAGFSRNQNLLKLRGNVRGVGKARLVFDTDLVYMGFSDEITDFSALTRREVVDPFRFETHNLYMEAWDVGLKGLDIRVGQQKIQWGAGDQFNPTNNLNADDVEDPLLFGDQLGNIMARVDYTPVIGWSLTGVVVPVFKPALLPESAVLGLAATDQVPVIDDDLRWTLLGDQAQALQVAGYPTVAQSVVPQLPDTNLKNMQWSVRLAGTLGMQDLALSYYDGISDIPQGVGNHTTLNAGEQCNPRDAEDCINGILETQVMLAYPKMKVWGFNASGEMNPLGWIADGIRPIGYRLEAAWIHPEETRLSLTNDELDFGFFQQPAGEYDYGLPGGQRPLVVTDDPFFKWTAGLDYSFGRHVYANVQWVHGFPDEFGAGDWVTPGSRVTRGATVTDDTALLAGCAPLVDTGAETTPERCATEGRRPRLGDYAVIGLDLMFGGTLLRTFAIFDLTPIYVTSWDADREVRVEQELAWSDPKTRSLVLYPELSHNFGNGFELAGGAVVFMGGKYTKFGDPAVGGTQVFSRARYSF
jgi:hypothetical protein